MKNRQGQNHFYTIYYQQIENEWTQNEKTIIATYIRKRQDFSWYGFKVCFEKSGARIYQYACLISRIKTNSSNFDARILNFLIKHFYIKAWQN